MRPVLLLSIPLLLLLVASAACAQAPAQSPQDPPIDAAAKKAVVDALGKKMRGRYVLPDVGAKVATTLTAKVAKGAYAQIHTVRAFAKALGKDLSVLSKDRHAGVDYDPDFKQPPSGTSNPPSSEQVAAAQEFTLRDGFGIARVERLPGNVGYLDLRDFGSAELVGAAYVSAMELLSGTDALILDLRQNEGGDPQAVAYLLSFFFPEGDSRHLENIYTRATNSTRQYWTIPLGGPRYAHPVYVLISGYTFSNGEMCAYDFQVQKRATLVGATTYGGANPPTPESLGHGFVAYIANDMPVNPVTRTNWGFVGVKPDVAVPAADAMKTAYAMILTALIPKAKNDHARDDLKATLERVEKGEIEKPHYTYSSSSE